MSNQYQPDARLQDKEKPGEKEEMERRRREREGFEKRFRGGNAAPVPSADNSSAEDYGRRISEVAQAAKEYVSDRSSVVGDRFQPLLNMDLGELAEDAKTYVRINPGKALLLSAGAGFLLGLLIRGRR